MLILIFAESALETVPPPLWNHPSVRLHGKKRGKSPRQLLLDRTYHHFAMDKLPDSKKRGRPDIIHFALLEALGSPLNKEGLLQTYVHTYNDFVVTVNSEVRLPRNYNRFVGLLEQLFEKGRVPPIGQPMLSLESKNLQQLLAEIDADYTLVLSRQGTPATLKRAVAPLLTKTNSAVIIGGFPHGPFSPAITKKANHVISIDSEMLETWTVTSRVIYEYEQALSLPAKRLVRG